MSDYPFNFPNKAQNKKNPKFPTDDNSSLVDQLLKENDEQRQKYTELKLKLKNIQGKLEEKDKEIENKDKKTKNLENQLNEILSDLGKGKDIKENYLKLKNENER